MKSTSPVGILLVNLGTPSGTDYWSIRRYLREFLSDRRVIEVPRLLWWFILNLMVLTKRPFVAGQNYRSIWNRELDESPLLTSTRSLSEKVAARLHKKHGDKLQLAFAMRYGEPSMASVLRSLADKGCSRILSVPLYPQYSATTTATANDQLFRALMQMRDQPSIRTAPPYYENPAYIAALSNSVKNRFPKEPPEKLILSYHGIPLSYSRKGDPYHSHCLSTTELLIQELAWPSDTVESCFQSRFGPEEWLQPYTVARVAELARLGIKNIAVMAPGFAVDCLETLEEINGEIRESFLEAGGETFTYISCLNDNDDHVSTLEKIVETEIGGWQ